MGTSIRCLPEMDALWGLPGSTLPHLPFCERSTRPANFGMLPSAHATIGTAHHILPPDNASPVDEASRDEFGMLHDVRGMTDHARHQDRAGCELCLFPDFHLVLVPHVRRLTRSPPQM